MVRVMSKKCKWFSVCPLRNFELEGKISDKWKNKYCLSEGNWKNCKRFQLEEKGEPHPDSMLPDGNIDKKLK